jgi:pimeloyl-ACP methyl ester carboxylesterase
VLWRLWFQPVIATPVLGPWLLGSGHQRLPRHLLRNVGHSPEAWTESDIELFLAPLRDPARARAAGALYRGYILREAARIVLGRYRGTRLRTPTHVLYGAEDPGIKPELLGGHEDHADHLEVELVRGAGHFVADDRPDVVVERALA